MSFNPFESKTNSNLPIITKGELDKVEVVEVISPIKKSRKQIILEQHGGLESNVPINSPYWRLK